MSLDSQHLLKFIEEYQLDAQIIHLESETPTVADAAEAVSVDPDQIIKTLLFYVDERPLLVIANGLTRVDYKRLADHVGMSRRRVKTARPSEVLITTGYPAGAVPPFGHKTKLRTIVEENVLTQTVIFGGGGEINALMRLPVLELRRVVGTETARLAKL